MNILKNNIYLKTICIFLAILLIILTTVLIFYFFVLPWGCNNITFWLKCVQFSEFEEQIKSPFGNLSGNYILNNTGNPKIVERAFLRYVADSIKAVEYQSTDDIIKDAEVVHISFRKDESEIKTVTFAYDFYQKKVYTLMSPVQYRSHSHAI